MLAPTFISKNDFVARNLKKGLGGVRGGEGIAKADGVKRKRGGLRVKVEDTAFLERGSTEKGVGGRLWL